MNSHPYIKFILTVLGTILVQFFFNEVLDIQGIRPDLFFILLIYLAFRLSPTQTVWAAFLLGILQDVLFHPSVLGLSPLIKTFSGFILAQLIHQSFLRVRVFSTISSVLLIFLSHVVFNWALFIEMPVDFNYVLINYSLPEFLYTGGLFLLANYFIPLYPETE
ncbi:rod shape-determining protein MreD [Fidelibacter multiformis]|jgi:rod shape-determining protein MreD|uniref:rod shape-determining protein MreD n=1 Tax=Fidelibacter multiformis TaxID=3377529 RepID=UPI0037DC6E40